MVSGKPVIVLGMHRSGTSLTARALISMGVHWGIESFVKGYDNPKGFWEHPEVVQLNERVLAARGNHWFSLALDDQPLPDSEWKSMQEEAISLAAKHFEGFDLWGFKDPRMCRLVPFWLGVFKRLKLDPQFIIVHRNPNHIALSLKTRNGFFEARSWFLWADHMARALRDTQAYPRLMIKYGTWLQDGAKQYDRIQSFLEINEVDPRLKDHFLQQYVDKNLNHALVSEVIPSPPGELPKLLVEFADCLDRVSQTGDQTELDDKLPQIEGLLASQQSLFKLLDESETQLKKQQNHNTQQAQKLEKVETLIQAMSGLESQQKELALQQKELTATQKELTATQKELASSLQTHFKAEDPLKSVLKAWKEVDERLSQFQEETQQRFESLRPSWRMDVKKATKPLTQLEQWQQNQENQIRNLHEDVSHLIQLVTALKAQNEPSPVEPKKRPALLRRLFSWTTQVLLTLYRKLPPRLQNLARRLLDFVPSRLRFGLLSEAGYFDHGMGDRSLNPWVDEGFSKWIRQICSIQSGMADIIVFPVIDWHFRFQRPQQLARELARKGHRVFYLSTKFLPEGETLFSIQESPAENVFIVNLHNSFSSASIYEDVPGKRMGDAIFNGVQAMIKKLQIRMPVSIVDLPFWRPIAERIAGNFIVYDCMDYHAGFSTNSQAMLREEDALIKRADLVITTSQRLKGFIEAIRPTVLIPNACEFDHFHQSEGAPPIEKTQPIIGYFGAISDWFDLELVLAVARMRPNYHFMLIGSTAGCADPSEPVPDNIQFFGELKYDELPAYLAVFDVCLIPFKRVELTLSTNPVKVFEYLSAGKPVVSTELPEVAALGDLVKIANEPEAFAQKVDEALTESNDPQWIAKRVDFAKSQTWSHRAEVLDEAIRAHCPKVSVVVLAYNNLVFTQACLHSLMKFTDYPNWELIVVNNGSSDNTASYLAENFAAKPHVKIINNTENLGFAAGNNVGLAAATGDFLIMLNNDTFVTQGWIQDLLRHFRQDPELGLLGPVTNNIGNEAKIKIEYANMEEMSIHARQYTQGHIHERFYVENVAFFCVALTRKVFQEIGPLDEAFGQGFFEDDDYCNRVRRAGLKIAIAEDVFIHHHLSASFNQIGQQQRQALFEQNKAIYEKKWGPWKPHVYRN